MRIIAENKELKLVWKIPMYCMATFPSLKKLERGNTKDAEDKLSGVYTLLKGLKTKDQTWDEPFGGIGMTARLAEAFNMRVFINELDKGLYKYLREQYDEIRNCDAEKIEMFPATFRFYDPSHFTFNHLCSSFFQSLLMTNNTLLYTDVFPFSLKPFDMDKLVEYLTRCKGWLNISGWDIDSVFLYRSKNAMIVKARKNKKVKQIINIRKAIDPFEISIQTGLLR